MKTFLKLFLEWWKYCVLITIGIVLVLGIRAALESRDAKVQMEATLKAQQVLIAEKDKQIAAREQDIKRRDAKAESDKASIDKQLKEIKTSQQAIAAINKWVPLTTPIDLRSQSATSSLPDAPSQSVCLDLDQQKDIALFAGRARQCEIDRSRYIADVSDLQETIADKNRQLEAKDEQLKSAVQAVNGGTKWVRFKKAAKHIGIGVAVGIAVGAAAKR